MNKIIVARRECGCIVAAALDTDYPGLAEDVLSWVKDGLIVKYETRKTIRIERCLWHKGMRLLCKRGD